MKTLIFFLYLIICLVFNQKLFGQRNIDSIKIMPSIPNIHDSISFITYSKPFSGDCGYVLKMDSVRNNKIYISGKYNSNIKCLTDGANDTINLGLFPTDDYIVYYSFIDTYGKFHTSELTLNFTVTESSSLIAPNYQRNIKVYPNPCSSYAKIYLSSSQNSKKSFVQLFNLLGQLEFEEFIQCNNSELTIDMSNRKQGIYFLRIDNNELKLIKH